MRIAEAVRDAISAGIAPEETGESMDTGRIHRNGLRRGIVEWLKGIDLAGVVAEVERDG
jgi:hypothetical protein